MAKKRDRREYLKKWQEANKEKERAKRILKKEKIAEYNKLYREKNKDKLNEYSRNWNKQHKEHLKIYSQKTIKTRREKNKIRRYTDLAYRTAINLRARFRIAVKNKYKAGSAVRDLGCSIEFFIKYIEQQFTIEMNWDNYGKVWNYDHIIPLSKVDLTKREEVLKVCHFTNIKPMLISENSSKNNKLDSEFIEYKRKKDI